MPERNIASADFALERQGGMHSRNLYGLSSSSEMAATMILSDLILNLGPQSLGRRILRDQCRASRLKVHLVIWYNFASVEELVPDQENKEERDGEVIGDESLRARSVWGLSLLRWDY